MKRTVRITSPYLLLLTLLFVVSGCATEQAAEVPVAFQLDLPAGFPHPEIPEDNELTAERVAFGKALFFDPRLSRDSTISCASCHLPSLAFSDQMPVSRGIEGKKGFRNAPSLANIAYDDRFFMDGGVLTLEMQVLVPLDDSNEMDLTIADVVQRFAHDSAYQSMARKTYDRDFDPFVITRAIAAFERTLISGNSRFDQFHHQGLASALSESEQRGLALFKSDRLQCSNCHTGFAFTNKQYENNGLYRDYGEDPGRKRITLKDEDEGRFKVPGLRNVALTGPYMHDGSLTSLEAVVNHYASGGQPHPNKSEKITGFTLTPEEQADLIAFLESLTDEDFVNNLAFRK